MTNRQSALLGFALALASLAPAALAQQGTEGTVAGTGMVSIKRQADVLRMEVILTAEGKDAAEAVAKLGDLQAAAKAKLLALGAAEGSVDVGTARAQMSNDRQQQMQRMVRMRMSQGKK